MSLTQTIQCQMQALTGKDVKGGSHDLIWGTIPTFAKRDGGKP